MNGPSFTRSFIVTTQEVAKAFNKPRTPYTGHLETQLVFGGLVDVCSETAGPRIQEGSQTGALQPSLRALPLAPC